MNASLLDSLRACLPGLQLKTDAADLEYYGRDWTRRWTPAPLVIALPASIEDVRAIVCWASAHGVAIVPSGGRTGLSGGAVARVEASELTELVITDSIQPTDAVNDSKKVRALTVAPLLGEAIKRIADETSVSSLFD